MFVTVLSYNSNWFSRTMNELPISLGTFISNDFSFLKINQEQHYSTN